MFANSLNDWVLWKCTGMTHVRGKRECKKNECLESLWRGIEMKMKVVNKENGKISYEIGNVSDGDILHFLYSSSKALKVSKETLAEMRISLQEKNERNRREK